MFIQIVGNEYDSFWKLFKQGETQNDRVSMEWNTVYPFSCSMLDVSIGISVLGTLLVCPYSNSLSLFPGFRTLLFTSWNVQLLYTCSHGHSILYTYIGMDRMVQPHTL